jgi:hypothetical protein
MGAFAGHLGPNRRGARRHGAGRRMNMLSAPMIEHAFGARGAGRNDGADTRAGTYIYNDAGSTRRDHEGLVFAVPKHFPARNGLRTEINLFKDVEFLKASDWVVSGSSGMSDYQGPGEGFTVTDAPSASNAAVSMTLLPSVDIKGKDFLGISLVRAGSAAEVGNTAKLLLQQESGGSSPSVSVTVTLTADWQMVTTPVMTGLTNNIGVKWQWRASSTSEDFDFDVPTLVEVTDRSNKTPPLPIPVDTPHEYAREIYTTANALGSVNNADSTTGVPSSLVDTFRSQQVEVPPGYSNAIEVSSNVTPAGAARLYIDLDALFSLVDGKRYAISYWLRHVGTGGAVGV